MESFCFEVGAKAARLIGRENVANVDSALIELIKNSYDADASCVCVYFDMPFPYVPENITAELARQLFSAVDIEYLSKYYEDLTDGVFPKKKDLQHEDLAELRRFLMSFNRIIIADNGHGMSYDDVRTKWMYIGTSDKEIHKTSPGGRVKTGAKGIGRFALDKLSEKTSMITRKDGMKTVFWSLDWNQFENTKLLNEIHADVDTSKNPYELYAKKMLGREFGTQFAKYSWKSGTLLVLSPIREDWSMRLFEKTNNNLKSINPLGTADPFRVFVKNRYYPIFNFETAVEAINENDYDYKISVKFDGVQNLKVTLLRNEVDVHKKYITMKKYNRRVELSSFWERPYFNRKNYRRMDFESMVETTMDITKILDDAPEKIRNVGSFEADMYFGKNVKSSEEIIKNIVAKKRKRLYGVFSGIKIYRDQFKVRPYGDEGAYMDWLGLGRRQTLSPGGVGDETHDWKVLAYQIIGQVKISRDGNPGLCDMANREGLKQNDEYQIFCEMLLKAIDLFEIDRRGFYREYVRWKNDVEKELGTDANIRADVLEEQEKKKRTTRYFENERKNKRKYTEEEYRESVYNLIREKNTMLNEQQMLQLLSSSGLILNTFFHEFKAMEAQFAARVPQLRRRIEYMIENDNLHPGFAYDPFIILDSMQETDAMMATWMEIAINKMERRSLDIKKDDFLEELRRVLMHWENLLDKKQIQIKMNVVETTEYTYSFSKADLYIIINNFMLNSVYFLEKGKNEHRMIEVSLDYSEDYYNLKLWNNGPPLDGKYHAIPEKIFELGESSKENDDGSTGTGVGLWITKKTVERYGGTITVIDRADGFGLDIYLRKEGQDEL